MVRKIEFYYKRAAASHWQQMCSFERVVERFVDFYAHRDMSTSLYVSIAMATVSDKACCYFLMRRGKSKYIK